MLEFIAIVVIFYLIISLSNTKKKLKNVEATLHKIEKMLENTPHQIEADKMKTVSETTAKSDIVKIVNENEPEENDPQENEPQKKVKQARTKTVNKVQFGSGLLSVESIISKLGILLLIIGIGFVYKTAYDRGFITNGIVVITGYFIGVALFVLGQITYKKNRYVLSQVLFGGGVATHFIVTFAAYQQYQLIHTIIAFIVLLLVTGITLMYSISYDSRVIGSVGILGALLIPFLVGIDYLGFYGVGVYMVILALCGMVLYRLKYWRTIQLSTVIGVNIVTFILAFGVNKGEQILFVILVIALLLIFIGVEYYLYYGNHSSVHNKDVTNIILITLPIVSFVQVQGFSLGSTVWMIIMLFMIMLYTAGYFLLVLNRGLSVVADILLSYVALFAVIESVLVLDGNVSHILIGFLAIMFYYLANRQQHVSTRIIAHVILVIGLFIGLGELILNVIDGDYGVAEITGYVMLTGIYIVGCILNSKKTRIVIGSVVLLPYSLLCVLSLVVHYTMADYIYSALLITMGILLWVYIGLNRRFYFLNIPTIITVAFLPFLFQLIYGIVIVNYSDNTLMETLVIIGYGINLYLIATFLFDENTKIYKHLSKVFAYLTVGLAIMTSVYSLLEKFNLSLIIFGGLLLMANRFEPDIKTTIIKNLVKVLQILLLVMTFIYALLNLGRDEFVLMILVYDIALLAVVYYTVKNLKIGAVWSTLIRIGLYMILVYQNLNMINGGIVTLTWATYAVISLFYHIKQNDRQLIKVYLAKIVYIAVKLIVFDLATIDILWKVVTSISFGVGLLILSYFIQPIMKDADNTPSEM